VIRNVAGQKVQLFVFDYSTGAPKTGDAANLTAYVKKDSGSSTALVDTSATEVSSSTNPGWYEWDVSQAETDATDLLFTGKSTTANVAVVGFRAVTVLQPFLKTIGSVGRFTVSAGATTTSLPTSVFSPAGASADQFKGRIITFDGDTTTAALRGQSASIQASTNSATPTLTIPANEALSATPANGDTGSIT
jgi:hypothetical protein